jgi:hypothetical protein
VKPKIVSLGDFGEFREWIDGAGHDRARGADDRNAAQTSTAVMRNRRR